MIAEDKLTVEGILEVEAHEMDGQKVIVKKGRESYEIEHPRLRSVLMRAYGLYRDIKAIEPTYQDYKAYIAEQAREHTDGTVSFGVQGAEWICKVSLGWECVVMPEHVERLKGLLGERFNDLVKVKTTYTGTQKLIELAADKEKGREISNCLVIKEKTPSVRFEK